MIGDFQANAAQKFDTFAQQVYDWTCTLTREERLLVAPAKDDVTILAMHYLDVLK